MPDYTDYIAPAFGSPVWIEMFATDLPRVQAFYSTIFHWKFPQGAPKDTDGVTMFKLPEEKFSSIGGNFTKIEANAHTTGSGTPRMYLVVDDVEKTMEAIVANGGVKQSEKMIEGDEGFIMHFGDSEGNKMGIWMPNKPEA